MFKDLLTQNHAKTLYVENNPLYTNFAHVYDDIYYDHEKYNNEINFILQNSGMESSGARVLDVGCGTGTHISMLIQYGCVVTGLDLNRAMLKQAEIKCPQATFLRADMRTLNLGTTFDLVMCMFGAINYLENRRDLMRALVNFYRHIRPGGNLVIETRWTKNLPESSWIEHVGPAIVSKWWGKQRGIRQSDLYTLTYFDPQENLFFLDVHNLFYQDPFMIVLALQKVGFKIARIFENRNLPLPFLPWTEENEALILAHKPLT